MSIDEDHVYSAGNNSGYVLTISSNPYANQTITNNLYNTLNGLTYQPFVISCAIYNPAAELGDTVVAGDVRSIFITETRSYDIGFRSDAEAPGKDEMDDEYPYPSKIKRLQNSLIAAKGEIYSKIEQTQSEILLEVGKKVNKDGIVAQINLGLEKDGSGSYIKIAADHLDLSGCAKFTDLSTDNNYTIINGANIQTGTVTADKLNASVITSISTAQSTADTAQSTADGANTQEQYIYISKATGTTSVSANTTWVTDVTGGQNKWTAKRPEYSSSYPVLFMAKQSQTVAQKKAGSTCTCTTPAIDKTTTVIDGGNIITGSITAGKIAASTITGDKIAGTTITGDKIAGTTITGDKIAGSTITADKLSASVITSISTAQSTADTAQSTADGANAREQYIYISKATGTTSVSANTTWVTDVTGNQNTWTTKRPVYSSSYPVLFIAKQSQTVAQKKAGSTCACTTPTIDKTTTVIDGGNIITSSITATQIAAHTITAAEIKANSITATEIDATNLHVKGANIDDTLSASKIYGGTLTLGGSNNGKGTLVVKDASDTTIGSFNKDGITLNKGNIYFDRNSSIITYLTDDKNSYIKLSGNQTQTSGTGVGLYYRYGDATARLNAASEYNILATDNYYYDSELYMSGCYNRWASIKPGYFYITNPSYTSGVFQHTNYTDVGWDGNTFEVYGEKSLYVRVRSKDDTGIAISNGNRIEWGGDLYVSGTKSRVVTTDQYNNRFLYCYETPSPMFGDVGEGTIAEDGFCYIWFDPIFAQTISTKQYQVFLQKYSEGDCHVSKRDGSFFVVEGTPGLSFGWEAKAKQRDYEELRLEEDDKPFFALQIPQYGNDAAAHIAQIRKEREVA
jgi:hypothetical protein